MNTVRTGLPAFSDRVPATIALATSSARVMSGGMKMTMIASIPGSLPRISIASRYCCGVAEAIMSTGFEMLASAGRNSLSFD